MTAREQFRNWKGRLKEKTRQTLGGWRSPVQSTSPIPDVQSVSPSTNPVPDSLAIPIATASTPKRVSAPPGGESASLASSWTYLNAFLQILDERAALLGPLKPAIGDLVQCIDIHEEAAISQRDYATLKMELEGLFSELGTHFSGNVPPTMTASMDNLCKAIENELDCISTKEKGGTTRRHLEARKDVDDVIDCYRRIHGHLKRLTLNADLSTWKIVDEQATEMRLKSLTPSMSACYNSAEATQVGRRECTPKTREQVISDLSSWRHDKQRGNMYWLNGMAGTGKTTIANSLCAMLDRSHELGASFFCTPLLPECRNVKLILPTIAYQLACFSRPYRCALSRALEHDPNMHTKALPNQLEGLIVGPLREVAHTLPTELVVVIDALDECDDNNGVGLMLEALARHAPGLPLKIFVSSRPEPQIRQKIGSTESQLILHELDKSMVKEDIETYLRVELACMSLSESQMAALVERAGALFIYAATVVRYIGAEGFSLDPTKRLAAVLDISTSASSNKHKEIDALYAAVLDAAFNNPNLEPSDQELMKLVLDTVVCTQEPLTVDALAGLLQLGGTGKIHAALRPLWSVLHISGANSFVTTLHVSFPEYMLDPARSKDYKCTAQAHHGRLSELCFERIENNKPQFNVCGLESSYLFDEQVSDLEDRVTQAVPLDLAYACQYWGVHLNFGERSSTRVAFLDRFLSTRLLLWMEVLNLKKRMNIGAIVLEEVRRWCNTEDCSRDLKELVHDAWRFTTVFSANPVSRSTPHIYLSMLPSWPMSRPITNRYIKRTDNLVRVGGTGIMKRQLALLIEHVKSNTAKYVTFSPNGTRIVSGSWDSTISVWDAQNGQLVLGPLKGHTRSVNSIAFSPDGARIVSGSDDKTLRVWDLQSGSMALGPLEGHTGSVESVAFSPDGMYIASGSEDRTICIWNGQSGKMVLGPFEAHTNVVSSIAFSPDGARIASGSWDGTISLWDARRGQLVLGPLNGNIGSVWSDDFSPDGTRIVAGYAEGTICVWDAQSGKMVLSQLKGHANVVTSVAFSPDGVRVASGSFDGIILVRDAQNGEIVLGPLKRHDSPIRSIAFSPNGMRIASCSDDSTICVWDAQMEQLVLGPLGGRTSAVGSAALSSDGMRIGLGLDEQSPCVSNEQSGRMMVQQPLQGHTNPVCSVAFSPDGRRIASGSWDNTICVWDVQSEHLALGPLEGHTGGVNSVAFSHDGMRIASGSVDETIRVWNAQNGQIIFRPLIGHTSSIYSVAFLSDGFHIASAARDRTIRVWDVQSGQSVLVSLGDPEQPHVARSIASSPDGTRFAVGYNQLVCVRDARSGQMTLGPLEGHTTTVMSVAFSPDGTRIVSGSADATICVWSAQSGQLVLGPLKRHLWGVYSVVFSPDGTLIASGSEDTRIIVWDAHSGQIVLGPLKGHLGTVWSVAFSPDGMHIASGSHDKTIRVWKVQGGLPTLENTASHSPASDLPSSTQGDPTSHRQRLSSDFDWTIDTDGWVLDGDGRLLLWVPPDLRTRLLRPHCTFSISTQGYIRLGFENAKFGDCWTECYMPA